MKIMKASNYSALLPPGSSKALADSDCQGFICACMCVSFVSRQTPEACQPRQVGSSCCFLANSRCCTDLLAVLLSGCQGGDHGKEPQPLKGIFFLQHWQRCSTLFCESLYGYQNHLVMLGQHFSSSGTLSFPGTKPKATDPAKHLTKKLSKVISRRNKILWLDHSPFGPWLWNYFCLSFYLLKGGFNTFFVEVPGTQMENDSREENIPILSCY